MEMDENGLRYAMLWKCTQEQFVDVHAISGENPKRVYGSMGKMPGSRLGEGWLLRQRFQQAQTLMRAQDDWCVAADAVRTQFGDSHAHLFVNGRIPEDLEHESLVALLRGDVKLNIHCYEVLWSKLRFEG